MILSEKTAPWLTNNSSDGYGQGWMMIPVDERNKIETAEKYKKMVPTGGRNWIIFGLCGCNCLNQVNFLPFLQPYWEKMCNFVSHFED